MIKQTSHWLLLPLLLAVVAWPVFAQPPAQPPARDPVSELTDARRIFVPVEDLDVIIERDKEGVLLPRAKFDVLLTQAKANAEKNAVPTGNPLVVTSADYAARIVGDQLLIAVTSELTQFQSDWCELRFPLQRLAMEQAQVDDALAQVGRHPDGSVSLFTDGRGKHTVKLQLSTELASLGSDQSAAFSLLPAPSGVLTLSLPAGKRLLIGALQLERPAPLDQVADYQVAIGGASGLTLRITDRAAENAADSLSFASTGYGLHVAPGEVTWQALTTLQVFGKPIDRLSLSVPRVLEIAAVESTGLESWDLTDDPDDARRTNLSLTFGQAFDGGRKISLKGVMAVETGAPWGVPPLRIANVTSHVGQVVVQYPAGVRLRVEETAGVRRATREQKPAADMPDEPGKDPATESLRFDLWQPDFLLRLTTQPKEREVQAAVAAVLDVNATGLELQGALTVETHFAPLFELDIRLASEWQVLSIQRDNQPLKWQITALDEVGVQQLRILLNPPLAAETSGLFRLSLRRDVEGWPVEAEPITVEFPELYLPQSSLSEGAFVVRGDDDLDLESLDLKGLDPQPLKAAFERLRFQSQDTRFAGKLKIVRKASRIAAQTVTFGRIDPQTFHTFIQSVVEVQGGGIRTLKVTLPESAGTAIRFESPSPRIVEQKAAAPQNGERIWTLQFDQRLRGQALIACDIELARGDEPKFVVPQLRFVDADRQNGYLVAEAGGEQRLTIVAEEESGAVLPEVDPLELPNVFYQPKERIVAVHRAPAAGAVLTLSEQKFEKLPVPTAICPQLVISTILGGTGELQHRATFQLNVVGVQGLHVTLPKDSTLWATLVDGNPVEVRRNGDVYLVPLTLRNPVIANNGAGVVGTSPPGVGELRSLQLFYRSQVGAVSHFGKLEQDPPVLTVESGQRTALPVEILEQKWDLHYPEETRLIESHSSLEPLQPMDQTSWLKNWNAGLFRIPTLVDLGWHLLAVLVTIGIIALLAFGWQQRRFLITQAIIVVVVFVVLGALVLPTVRQSRSMGFSLSKFAAPNSAREDSMSLDAEMKMRGAMAPMTDRMDKDQINQPLPESLARVADQKPGKPQRNLKLNKDEARSQLEEMMEAPAPMVDGPGPGGMHPGGMGGMPMGATRRMGGIEVQGGTDGVQKHLSTAPDVAKSERSLGFDGIDGDPPMDEARPQDAPFKDPLNLDSRQTQNLDDDADDFKKLALLSLAIDFAPPAGSREKQFRYLGADTSQRGIPLEVDYVDHHSGGALRTFIVALVAMIGWFCCRSSISIRIALATLGLTIPLALLPLAPLNWQPVLDGLFLGTPVAIGLWSLRGCVQCCGRYCCGCCSRLVKLDPRTVTTLLTLSLVLSQTVIAAGQEPAATPPPAGTTLIVPFDAGTEPLASERVFLSQEQFKQLYRLANPEKASKQPAPQAGGVYEALYAAKLETNATRPDESTIEVTARYAVKSFVDGQLLVQIPVGQVAVREAKLDGQTAALIANAGGFTIAVQQPGLHVIDFRFSVPAKLSGTTGAFTLPLLAVPTGKLVFELPAQDLSVRVNGSTTIFRRVTQDDLQSLEFPIDKGGDVIVSWQPKQAQGAAAAVIHVDSVEAITLTDAGTSVSHGFAYKIRQGGIADTSFTLPETLRLRAVTGADVGGWELQGNGADRKLRVIFRRNVADQTQLTIETFLDVKVDTDSTTINVPQLAPQEVTNEIGQVAVFAGNQFSLRAEQVQGLSQLDGARFATPIPVSRPSVAPQLAYRFSKRPFSLNLLATRQASQAHVTAQQGALISLRKQQLTTRLRYNLTGAPRSSVSISLPEKFVLLDVQATGLRDYYIARQEEEATLTIELNAPHLGLMEVVLGGFTPRENGESTIRFPQPLDVTRLDSTAAVWLEEEFAGTLETFDGWRSDDATQIGGELRSIRPQQTVQFAFSSPNLTPEAITLNLTQATPQLSANGLAMVTVTDVAVIEMLALQWQIDAAKTDTLTLTTPDWLAGKLDFQGQGIRDATHVSAGGNRTRWTIHLRTPVSGKYFATATATLPPPTADVAVPVVAPALVFEHDQKPLERQRQYVLLINSSLGLLSAVDTSLVESVQREDVPVVIGQEFIDQATELVRVKTLLTAPSWSLRKFDQEASAPASVNVADLTTIISRDGTYRGQGLYTIKNRSRQFLALQMPEGTELLSVYVADQPARAVTTELPSLNGGTAQLIALPKTSAASLSFPVKIIWRGRLSGPLPKSATFSREEFSIPAPQILSKQQDADYGIPVARTQWTVYLPDDLDAQGVRSTDKHNLSLADHANDLYGNAALQEASELLGYFEQMVESNKRVQSVNNLKQIGLAASNLKRLQNELGSYQNQSGDREFARNTSETLRRLSTVDQQAQQEQQKAAASFPSQSQRTWGMNSFQVEGVTEGATIAEGQQKAVFQANTGSGINVSLGEVPIDSNFNFSLGIQDSESNAAAEKAPSEKPQSKVASKKSKSAGEPNNPNNNNPNNSRSQLRVSNGLNIDNLNTEVTKNNTTRFNNTLQQQQGIQQNPGQSANNSAGFMQNGNGIAGNTIFNNGSLWNAQVPGNDFSELNMPQLVTQGLAREAGGMLGGGGMGGGMGPAPSLYGRRSGFGNGFSGGGFKDDAPGMMPSNGPAVPQSGEQFSNPSLNFFGVNPTDSRGGQIDGRNQFVAAEGQGGRLVENGRQAGTAAAERRRPSGLSIGITLPTSGRKLVFSKSGGDPKLTLAIRPQESVRRGLSLAWSAIWLLVAASVLFILSQASGVRRLLYLLPVVVALMSLIGFCVLPGNLSLASFVLFAAGGLVTACNSLPNGTRVTN